MVYAIINVNPAQSPRVGCYFWLDLTKRLRRKKAAPHNATTRPRFCVRATASFDCPNVCPNVFFSYFILFLDFRFLLLFFRRQAASAKSGQNNRGLCVWRGIGDFAEGLWIERTQVGQKIPACVVLNACAAWHCAQRSLLPTSVLVTLALQSNSPPAAIERDGL